MNADPTEVARRAPRITAEDVFAAADTLLGEGHKPTIDRVRMQLGRGSPNTINEHLDRWWRELGARFRASSGLALPGVPTSISDRLVELWHLALHESQQALQTHLSEREAALQVRETAVTEREVAVEGRLQAQADALHLAQTQLDEANQRARGLETTLQQAREHVEQLDTQPPPCARSSRRSDSSSTRLWSNTRPSALVSTNATMPCRRARQAW